MTPVRLVAVALGHARRRLVLSLAAILVAGVAAGAVVYLIGDSTQRSNNLLSALNSPDVRSVTIRASSDNREQDLLPARTVRNIAMLPGVERALGLSKVRSATTPTVNDNNVAVGYFVGTTLHGNPPYQLTSGQSPKFGEAIASEAAAQRLRLNTPTAGQTRVEGDLIPIVGTYDAPDLGTITELLNTSVLSPAEDNPAGYYLLVLIVQHPADVLTVVNATGLLLREFGTTRYTVEYDDRAAAVESLVSAAGRSGVRSTAIAIVGVGALIEAAVAFINAVLQRREIARRRALGFTRTMVFSTLVIEGGVLSGIGAAVGSLTATLILTRNNAGFNLTQPLATASFVAFIGILATLPGGALAALQDPARILRVP